MKRLALALCALLLLTSPARAHAGLSALKQTLIVVPDRKPLGLPSLITTDGGKFAPSGLKGHWSVVYFGFTSCPDVCPTTLHALGEVAANPASEGIEFLFVSIDPARDNPARIKAYLQAFSPRIQGFTGSPTALKHFSKAFGAAYQPDGTRFDHSTSLFVVDPNAALAGILLRPTDPARVVADLVTLRKTP
jgi:protein SCO1/2